jgi:capsular polysaccharide transport system permease protein
MYLSNADSFDAWSAARRQRRVLFALMLRNIRIRFFGHGFGYLLKIAWPLTHLVILVALFSLTGRAAPYGDSPALFFATGTIPYITFAYLARFMMLYVMMNRVLLHFPEVKILDVLFASALLEILSASSVVIVFIILAWFAAGLLNGVIALAIPSWFTGFSLILILVWATSGVMYVPDALPAIIREPLAYQPVLQTTEWMRSAYYEGYGNELLNRGYVIGFALVLIFLGLVIERATRGHMLSIR